MSDKAKKMAISAYRGKLLLALGLDKYLMQIVFFFVMAITFIGIGIGIDATMARKEKNKVVLENLRSIHTELSCTLTSLNSVCKVEDMLGQMGSDLKIPTKQATVVDR